MELDKLIDEIIEKIAETTTLLYQEDKIEGFKKLEFVISHLFYLVEVIVEEKGNLLGSKSVQELNTVLLNCVNAMEQKDTVLISDILNYDLVEMLEKMKNIL